ncbi:PEP-CTERM sorting domain-containing protein [Pseudoduganella sp. GCM10020061]|uniref:PEP-CTERM sorting domain-containing protein n=1 Tax=Pseudoduganella sp. GCM10020061 TaxID=3317345 RepID=UPI0036456FB8
MRILNALVVSWGLFLAVPAASAQTVTPPADFQAFSVTDMFEDSEPQSIPLVLVSDAAGATVFSVTGLSLLDAVSGGSFGVSEDYSLTLWIAPRPGYAITRYELSGTLTAQMQPGIPGPGAFNIRDGFASNNSEFGIYGPATGNVQINNVNGIQTFDVTVPGGGDVAPRFAIDMWGMVHANGAYTRYNYYDESGNLQEHKVPPLSNVAASDVRFTVYWEVVPVPEPATWALLLGGLLPLAAAGWSSRRARPVRSNARL